MAKSPEETRKEMIANLKDKTGKSFAEWQIMILAEKFAKHGLIMRFLKETHGVSHGYANQIALEVLRPADAPALGSRDLIEAQYAGKKAVLKPLYDELVERVRKFGKDVEFSPKKAYVSIRRKKQFAIFQPTTATRLDVGINLQGQAATDRLEDSGSFNAMVTHRVRVTCREEIDTELERWLLQAYEAANETVFQ